MRFFFPAHVAHTLCTDLSTIRTDPMITFVRNISSTSVQTQKGLKPLPTLLPLKHVSICNSSDDMNPLIFLVQLPILTLLKAHSFTGSRKKTRIAHL